MWDVRRNGAAGREAERAVGERSAAAGGSTRGAVPDPELVERARRRRFPAEYKLRILREADACTRSGETGALVALGRRRGRPRPHPLEAENAKLRQRLERADAELAKARKVIEVQGNVSALLGELLEPRGATPDASTEP